MSPQEFIDTIKLVVTDSAVSGTLKNLEAPPGRAPASHLIELSRWYHTLPPADQRMLAGVVQLAVDSAVFGFLCVIDGVRAISDSSHRTSLQLVATSSNGTDVLGGNDVELDLHDLY